MTKEELNIELIQVYKAASKVVVSFRSSLEDFVEEERQDVQELSRCIQNIDAILDLENAIRKLEAKDHSYD